MFLSELYPVFQELIRQPLAFTSGFVSGIFKLQLDEEPLSGWLAKQGYEGVNGDRSNNNSKSPQSIDIE
jgi:hypothetical protein